ncbi:unnamed protein product [Staurois parvus]|uniref:Uncharacterized protein n=1 Tax=Staurois parvus TaxID=386267 RepID=A0ABN9APV8_9NEOB|nr:unnamed protein product [Staurois parvus]
MYWHPERNCYWVRLITQLTLHTATTSFLYREKGNCDISKNTRMGYTIVCTPLSLQTGYTDG